MGEKTKATLKLKFDRRLRLEFHGDRITSDDGLLKWQCPKTYLLPFWSG